jgi:dephospho-CoA kinase
MDASLKRNKPIIGLAGGIGSGKTTVAAILGELGAAVVASDELNRAELREPEVIRELRGLFGDAILAPDGSIDRTAVRQIMAGNPESKRKLEAVLHPRVGVARMELTRRYQADPGVSAIIWDSPLLFEAGLDKDCDVVIFVEADERVRKERVAPRRGWTPEQWQRLEQTQMPLDFKRDKADYRVVNNSDRDDLARQVQDVFSRILSGA